MKNRLDQWITVVGFCLILGIVSVLYLVLPKTDFSETEKRYLEKPPVFTWQTLSSGQFGADMETYMADHIPGRDFLVGLNAYFDRYTGRQVSKDIYVAEGNRLVEAPVQWNEALAQKNVSAINSFAELIGRPVDMMIVPSAGWANEEIIENLSAPYTDEEMIARLYNQASSNVNTVDVLSVFENMDGQSLYYKTDHHWTSLGTYTAYKTYMEQLGKSYRPQEDFTVETVENFKGSTYSRATLWLTPGEDLELWHGSDNLLVTNGETEGTHEGVFYRERLEEADKYTVYLDGNHSIVRIQNPAGEGKILVIRDSYSNCLGTFLAETYAEVVLVDLRYYKNPISELCGQENFDDVLVCYSIGNFMTDTNLVWLR